IVLLGRVLCELYSTTDSIAMDFLGVQLHFTIDRFLSTPDTAYCSLQSPQTDSQDSEYVLYLGPCQ
ncbi:MAG: hypothetical protein LUE24_14735, partial [Lachnospiraceae bacterium]|nr:hypothetical protein [Lachnospiraceae bacterium]